MHGLHIAFIFPIEPTVLTEGPRGQNGLSDTNLGIAVGVSVAVFLIALVIIFVIIFIVVRRRRSRRGEYVLTVVTGKHLVSSYKLS